MRGVSMPHTLPTPLLSCCTDGGQRSHQVLQVPVHVQAVDERQRAGAKQVRQQSVLPALRSLFLNLI